MREAAVALKEAIERARESGTPEQYLELVIIAARCLRSGIALSWDEIHEAIHVATGQPVDLKKVIPHGTLEGYNKECRCTACAAAGAAEAARVHRQKSKAGMKKKGL
jgi:hypothetical protein